MRTIKTDLIVGSVAIFVALSSCGTVPVRMEWIASTMEQPWQEKEIVPLQGPLPEQPAIEVFPDEGYQYIDGFGGCFNELGWEALNIVGEQEQEHILSALFDTLQGCKFNLCRMPLGANDYSTDWYSHNETPNDFAMEQFSIERDKQRLIPYIFKAKAHNPSLKIWASPWCPPSWMKKNNHYACAPHQVNDLEESGRGREMENQFRMEPAYLEAYALYFEKFIRAYQNEGIDIYAVHVQNEPNSCQNFPSCVWTPSGLATFIGQYLGPHFRQENLSAEIWLGTIERPQPERLDTILNDSLAKKYIEGVGFQWAGKDAIPYVHSNYKNLKLMQTETECGNGSNDWEAALHTFGLMQHYFNHGANAYMYWNMVLDETGRSRWGWKQNSMITVNSQTKEITFNPEFYLMKHFSSFIGQGARRIGVSDSSCLAFMNKASIVVICYNNGPAKNKPLK
ncbi:MAG: hypothetical protein HC896_18115 [Bacteroidales bacterium]|nr:hypothetical protein [Bacteroidales bacterium]